MPSNFWSSTKPRPTTRSAYYLTFFSLIYEVFSLLVAAVFRFVCTHNQILPSPHTLFLYYELSYFHTHLTITIWNLCRSGERINDWRSRITPTRTPTTQTLVCKPRTLIITYICPILNGIPISFFRRALSPTRAGLRCPQGREAKGV